MKIKVCGTRDAGNIEELIKLSPDMIGFIFYPCSKRYASGLDKQVVMDIPGNIKKVGVFVNQLLDEVESTSTNYRLDYLQLHGDETPEFCHTLKKKGHKIIKVFGIAEPADFDGIRQYENHVDLFLFDTKSSLHGGTGQKFKWDLLDHYHLPKPFFLSGGISPKDIENLKQAYVKYKPYGIDINSKFETSPGFKDIGKTKDFIKVIKKI